MNGYHCAWRRQRFTMWFLLRAPGLVHMWPRILCLCRLLINDRNCLIHKKWCSSAWRWCIMKGGLSMETDVSFVSPFFFFNSWILYYQLFQACRAHSKTWTDAALFLLKYQCKNKRYFFWQKLTENVLAVKWSWRYCSCFYVWNLNRL